MPRKSGLPKRSRANREGGPPKDQGKEEGGAKNIKGMLRRQGIPKAQGHGRKRLDIKDQGKLRKDRKGPRETGVEREKGLQKMIDSKQKNWEQHQETTPRENTN